MSDDPSFYHRTQIRPAENPMWVTGFVFDPATATFDFSAVPGFDLARLQYLRHVKTGTFLYARPYRRPLDLAAVDGVPVPPAPTSGRVLKVQVDTSAMSAADEVLATYDPPPLP